MSVVTFPQYPDPLHGLSQAEFADQLRELIQDKAREVWIYGSVARGDSGPHSDIDLFIIADTDLPFHERGQEFDFLREFNINIEALVYTPAEWQRLTEQPTIGFWQHAIRDMKRLI